MNDTYSNAFGTMWKGMMMFIRCWASTLNRLGKDLLHGIVRHWFFALVLISAYAFMFMTMGRARAERDNHEQINYQLRQELDSIKIAKHL